MTASRVKFDKGKNWFSQSPATQTLFNQTQSFAKPHLKLNFKFLNYFYYERKMQRKEFSGKFQD
jgi:hypothetical protein